MESHTLRDELEASDAQAFKDAVIIEKYKKLVDEIKKLLREKDEMERTNADVLGVLIEEANKGDTRADGAATMPEDEVMRERKYRRDTDRNYDSNEYAQGDSLRSDSPPLYMTRFDTSRQGRPRSDSSGRLLKTRKHSSKSSSKSSSKNSSRSSSKSSRRGSRRGSSRSSGKKTHKHRRLRRKPNSI
jgi:hypothetical protein